MKFGLRLPSFALGPKTATLGEMGAYLRRAEDLGFDCAVSIDHLLLTPPAYACTWLEPVALLSALAGVTRTIKLGTMVLVLPLRNPASFAKGWATLDLLSGGRSILGVGVGWHEEEFALMGVPHRERGRGMDEMLEVVTALWAGDNVTYSSTCSRRASAPRRPCRTSRSTRGWTCRTGRSSTWWGRPRRSRRRSGGRSRRWEASSTWC